jgi:hypothetical protein
MLDFPHSLVIGVSPLLLMTAEDCMWLRVLVGDSVWVKNSDIKIRFLEPSTPKTTHHNIQTHGVISIDRMGKASS